MSNNNCNLRTFVLWYLVGELVAGAVLDRRARKRIRREAQIREQGRDAGQAQGYRAGFAAGYPQGYQDASGRACFFAYTRRVDVVPYVGRSGAGKSAIAAGDAQVPRTRRYW